MAVGVGSLMRLTNEASWSGYRRPSWDMSNFVASSVQKNPRPGSRGQLLSEPTSPHPYLAPSPQTLLYRATSTSLAFPDAARDRARAELRHSLSSAGRDDGDDAAPVARRACSSPLPARFRLQLMGVGGASQVLATMRS